MNPYAEHSYLNNPTIALLIFGILVQRLGGEVTITQKDIDQIAFGRIYESGDEHSVTFKLVVKEAVQ